MDWPPRLQYITIYPANLFDDEEDLTTQELGARWRVWRRLFVMTTPGLMAPLDLERIWQWTRLERGQFPPAEVARLLQLTLAPYEFHPATGSLHIPEFQKAAVSMVEASQKSKYAVAVREEKRQRQRGLKIGAGPARPEAPASPYARYREPFWSIRQANWQEILQRLAATAPGNRTGGASVDDRSMIDRSSTDHPITTTTSTISTSSSDAAAAPPPLGEGGGAGGDNLDAFLAQISDAQLVDLQRLWQAGGKDFIRQRFCNAEPRRNRHHAAQLWAYARQHPDWNKPTPAQEASA